MEPCIAKPICDILRKWSSEEKSIDELLSEVSEELIQGKNEPGNLKSLKQWLGDTLLWEMACDILRKWSSEEKSIDKVLSEVSEELIQGKNEPGNL